MWVIVCQKWRKFDHHNQLGKQRKQWARIYHLIGISNCCWFQILHKYENNENGWCQARPMFVPGPEGLAHWKTQTPTRRLHTKTVLKSGRRSHMMESILNQDTATWWFQIMIAAILTKKYGGEMGGNLFLGAVNLCAFNFWVKIEKLARSLQASPQGCDGDLLCADSCRGGTRR